MLECPTVGIATVACDGNDRRSRTENSLKPSPSLRHTTRDSSDAGDVPFMGRDPLRLPGFEAGPTACQDFIKCADSCSLRLGYTCVFCRYSVDLIKTKKNANPLRISASYNVALYPGWDSNPHSLWGQRILSPSRLPIPPPGQQSVLLLLDLSGS